ncbi:polyhydroxybutyrate depolymerase [Diaminobutyricimonas aerilata]|uniref:Polyhydroxybutyrate depolymerase n=1 Tax=Diaminobutyricimonas aerilata TaxID=1162967 RepID=A0A2M9CG89_9MICO|nr:alpha/beta fold hydrolase [Diaminobutyricimonas aerilata]PJJ70880.1 polyhydroxybutyrate depolymerase [Diaminobutyricimonas aerilata]
MHESIEVAGRSRTLTVIGDPTGRPGRGLVLILHGSRQTGEVHRRFTGASFDALADRGTAVVAYLDGYRGNWNDARRESRFPARRENIDDVGFVRAVIDRLAQTHAVDRRRVVVAGFSNGGQMAMRLIHEVPDLLAGAAVVGATMPSAASFVDPRPAAAAHPLPVLLVHGTADPIAPFEGGRMRGWAERMFKVGGTTLSMVQTAEYFARRNGVTDPPRTSRVSPEGRRPWAARTDYTDRERPPVRLFTIHGGGHTVPGPKRAPFILGRTGRDISTAEEVARFFGVGTAE